MPLKTDGIDEPELNLTPMIDIVFLLIIFFLVGTEFAEDKSVEEESTLVPIELPTSSSESSITPGPDPVLVSITKQGELYLGSKQVSLQELREDLKLAKKLRRHRRHHRRRRPSLFANRGGCAANVREIANQTSKTQNEEDRTRNPVIFPEPRPGGNT